jgi:hypothetical protein
LAGCDEDACPTRPDVAHLEGDTVVADQDHVLGGPDRAKALALEQRKYAEVRAAPLRVDSLEVGPVSVDRVLGVGDRSRIGPNGRVLQNLDSRVVLGHTGIEGVGAVCAVGRSEVSFKVKDVTGLHL